mgnify:FL=1
MDNTVIGMFLPLGLLEHFSIKDVKELGDVSTKKMQYEIYLEENNEILGDYDISQYESKGFTEVTLQDFPIRGKAVFLKIKRRRWRHKEMKNEIIRNDFAFVAEGAGFTRELSDFLKGTGRYTGGHDH